MMTVIILQVLALRFTFNSFEGNSRDVSVKLKK